MARDITILQLIQVMGFLKYIYIQLDTNGSAANQRLCRVLKRLRTQCHLSSLTKSLCNTYRIRTDAPLWCERHYSLKYINEL